LNAAIDGKIRRPWRKPAGVIIGCVAALILGRSAAATACAPDDALYIAIDAVRESLGVKGESRKRYLDRVYGRWQEDTQEIIRSDVSFGKDGEAVRIVPVALADAVLERVDIVVESRLDYLDKGDRRTEVYGHREIGRYQLATGATNEIAVPKSVFREPGALLVAVTVRYPGGGGEHDVIVQVLPMQLSFCPRRVYVYDRFTAIRMNRGHGK